MPLVRLQVRNEFGLGQPELYKGTNREDPKAVLDGVAVAGLVGILRQLGDLADFAAEVFHGLQEQVMTTASRSHKLMVRVQNIEASLPSLEKAVLAQTSHIHFAYTAGYEWHPRIKTARNHFIYNDLPQFIMDSYEECRDPPRLHVLDKFDTGGPGSCLRRYSDPTFFKRVSAYSDEAYSEKFERARKSRKSKKKRSSRRSRDILRGEQMHSSSGRMQFISPAVNGRTPSRTASTIDMTMKSDFEDHSNSFDSRPGYIECVFHPSNSLQPDEQDYKELSSSRMTQKADTLQSVSPVIDDNFSLDSLEKQIASSSSGVTWDEKEEIVESKSHSFHRDKTPEVLAEVQDVDRLEDEVTPAERQDMDLHEDVATHAGKQDVDMHEDEVTLSEKQDVDNHVDEAVSLTNIDHNDILFDEESNLQRVSSRVQTDDIDSEPDSYVDALNTIESESENDPDYETKREAERFSSSITHRNVENRVVEAASNVPEHDCETKQEVEQFSSDVTHGSLENRIGEPVSNVIDRDLCVVSQTVSGISLVEETGEDFPDSLHEIPALESNTQVCNPPPPDVPVIEEMTRDLADSHGFGSPTSEQVPHVSGNSVLECSVGNGSSDNANTHNDTVVASIDEGMLFNGSKSCDLLDKQAEGINNITKPRETVTDSAIDHAVRFWTNGGLLGLEPSKPPVFTSSLTQASSITRNGMDGGLNHNSMLKSSGHNEEQELSTEIVDETQNVPSSRGFTSGQDNPACISEKKSGSVLPVVPDSKANCTEGNQGINENSSRVFGFSHRLLINSFRQKVSFDENSGPDNSSKTGILEQRRQNGIEDHTHPGSTFKTQASYRYPIDSLPPSPPLEHMKISFHPISGLETSKLKLKFPDGTNHHESIRDVFPAFQLVPEPSMHLHDARSNSDDDDTFCRSSPYVSDDCRSLHSDYNSDQWESDETPESSSHGANESSQRISSTESMLSSRELKGVDDVDVNVANGHVLHTQNGVEPSLSGPMLDFPSFDTVNPVREQENNKHSDCDNIATSQSTGEPAPPPPPLPPMQWRVSKLQFDITNEAHNHISEDTQQSNDLNPSEFDFSQQARPAQVEQENPYHVDHESRDDMVHKLKHRPDHQKLNGQKEANLVGNGKEMDEREDFLHQIRTKSFNLRRTTTGKPEATTAPTAHIKVTAILEKANAIRQVVASDDDDTWSDM